KRSDLQELAQKVPLKEIAQVFGLLALSVRRFVLLAENDAGDQRRVIPHRHVPEARWFEPADVPGQLVAPASALGHDPVTATEHHRDRHAELATTLEPT